MMRSLILWWAKFKDMDWLDNRIFLFAMTSKHSKVSKQAQLNSLQQKHTIFTNSYTYQDFKHTSIKLMKILLTSSSIAINWLNGCAILISSKTTDAQSKKIKESILIRNFVWAKMKDQGLIILSMWRDLICSMIDWNMSYQWQQRILTGLFKKLFSKMIILNKMIAVSNTTSNSCQRPLTSLRLLVREIGLKFLPGSDIISISQTISYQHGQLICQSLKSKPINHFFMICF